MSSQTLIERFAQRSPVSLMAFGLLRSCFEPVFLNQIALPLQRPSVLRELPFSALVELMAAVAFDHRASIRQAYLSDPLAQATVSLKCVYQRLHTMPRELTDELVHAVATRLQPLLEPLTPTLQSFLTPPAAKPLRWSVLDGTHLAPTQRRLQQLQGLPAPQPGFALVLRDQRTGLLVRMHSCEDAHTNERACFASVLDWFQANDAVIADSSFCTHSFLAPLIERGVRVVVRHHGSVGLTPLGEECSRESTPAGEVSEVRVGYAQTDLQLRCVTVHLKRPTQDGQTEVRVLTNLPLEQWSAVAVAQQYLERRTIESAFQELTEALEGEINTLAHPRAALFAFGVAVSMYNVLATIRQIAQQVHPQASLNLSPVLLAGEIRATWEGMEIALEEIPGLPDPDWETAALRAWLEVLAQGLSDPRYAKSKRGYRKKTKPVPRPKSQHTSTYRVLHPEEKNQKNQR